MEITPDQVDGVTFLHSRAVALLADAPGVGKTAQVVRALDLLGQPRVTALMPNYKLCRNFQQEVAKWSLWGHAITILKTSKSPVPDQGIVITTYALARRVLMRDKLKARGCDVLVCDESHALKDVTSQQSKAVLGKFGIITTAKQTWFLTGSPVRNHAGDEFIYARSAKLYLGSYTQWINTFCETVETPFGYKIKGSRNMAELKKLLAPVYLRREKVEGRPALTITHESVENVHNIDPFATLSEQERDALMRAIETGRFDFREVPHVATVRRLVGMAKCAGIEALARDEMDTHEKMLIFCWHTDVIAYLKTKLAKFDVRVLDGSTTRKQSDAAMHDFQETDNARIIIGQTRAAGEGLTLTRASRVLIAEPSWVPDENSQAYKRAWRRGQTKPVHVSYLSLEKSLDARITDSLVRKSRDIDALL